MGHVFIGDEMFGAGRELSDGAYRLHLNALQWSALMLLDLEVPKRDLGAFAQCRADTDQAVAELLRLGWWEDTGGSWWIGTRFGYWQPTREQVENRKARKRKNTAGWRLRKCQSGEHSNQCPPSVCPLKSARGTAVNAPTNQPTSKSGHIPDVSGHTEPWESIGGGPGDAITRGEGKAS